MERVNDPGTGMIRFPTRRKLRRWPFGGGRWIRGRPRETRVVDLERYRQRRRLRLPASSVPTTGGDPA